MTFADSYSRSEHYRALMERARHDYEEDHLVSLELGGHPTDSRNLWPQLWDGQWGAHKKDVVETRLKTLVCNGKISLSAAQTAIRTNWIAAYQRYVKPN